MFTVTDFVTGFIILLHRVEYLTTMPFFMKEEVSLGLLPRICFSLLTGLLVPVCTELKAAVETASVIPVCEAWISTSQQKVTKFQLSDFVMRLL